MSMPPRSAAPVIAADLILVARVELVAVDVVLASWLSARAGQGPVRHPIELVEVTVDVVLVRDRRAGDVHLGQATAPQP
jgi:hypothetical protein